MRIIYILIICSLAGVLLLWLGIYKKISRKTAAVGAALSLALAGALLLLAVLPGNSFYGKVITHAENTHGRKLIALTFDDGPYPPYTQKLLKLLAAKNVHATFFMVGENAAKHPETVKLVQAQGHLIALHAGYHKDLRKARRGRAPRQHRLRQGNAAEHHRHCTAVYAPAARLQGLEHRQGYQ